MECAALFIAACQFDFLYYSLEFKKSAWKFSMEVLYEYLFRRMHHLNGGDLHTALWLEKLWEHAGSPKNYPISIKDIVLLKSSPSLKNICATWIPGTFGQPQSGDLVFDIAPIKGVADVCINNIITYFLSLTY